MNSNDRKYVDQHRAAALLRLAEKDLSRLSGQAGLGRTEENAAGSQVYYSYDDLRRICQLTVRRVA
ncbi:MAG: hypothetical protein LAN71_12600 [Acidobacteriia bacterium]|nr:hypothetical protein [Terriglobia bacterium]